MSSCDCASAEKPAARGPLAATSTSRRGDMVNMDAADMKPAHTSDLLLFPFVFWRVLTSPTCDLHLLHACVDLPAVSSLPPGAMRLTRSACSRHRPYPLPSAMLPACLSSHRANADFHCTGVRLFVCLSVCSAEVAPAEGGRVRGEVMEEEALLLSGEAQIRRLDSILATAAAALTQNNPQGKVGRP